MVVAKSAAVVAVTACELDMKLKELRPLLLFILLSVGDGIILAASPLFGSIVVVDGGDDKNENPEAAVAVGADAATPSP